jgi:hypothetical protein
MHLSEMEASPEVDCLNSFELNPSQGTKLGLPEVMVPARQGNCTVLKFRLIFHFIPGMNLREIPNRSTLIIMPVHFFLMSTFSMSMSMLLFFNVYFFVLIIAKSKWVEVQIIRDPPTTSIMIELLKDIFCTHGFPETIVSDNVLIFQNENFKNSCQNTSIL